jgi:arylsulfatase A-like enzyme
MNRSQTSFRLLFLSLLSGCFVLATPPKTPAPPKPYNVLFIAIDDMNNWVGAMGGPAKTPNIDRLARRGMLFTNAYCAFPACNPSRTAIMTGQRPETTGQFENMGNFRDKPGGKERITLPTLLQKFGYETIAAGKIFHNPRGNRPEAEPVSDPVSWTDQRKGATGTPGDKLYLDEYGQAKWMELPPPVAEKPIPYLHKAGIWGPIPQTKEQCGDWQMAQYGADFLQQKTGNRSTDKPFFLAMGLSRPHSPQLAPQEYFDRFPLDKVPMPNFQENDMDDIPATAQTNFASPFVQQVKAKGQLQKAMQGYLASMAFADDCVGKILDGLENGPYRDNTIVVFYTDHGWQLGHKNRWEKYSLWKLSTNSPLIIWYPGMKQTGKTCERAVSLMDLYPTVLDLLGRDKPAYLEGHSLLPLLTNPRANRDVPALITYPAGNHSVVLNEWNYIHYQDGSEELYNHKTDPNEFSNLAGRAEFGAIKNTLKAWLPKPAQKL